MLKAFSIQNYKNLQFEGDLTFNPKLNIFIGPNNSGKSNLIDAMNFWADILEIGFQQSLLKPLSLNEELRQFVKDGWELGDLYRVGDPVIGGWHW